MTVSTSFAAFFCSTMLIVNFFHSTTSPTNTPPPAGVSAGHDAQINDLGETVLSVMSGIDAQKVRLASISTATAVHITYALTDRQQRMWWRVVVNDFEGYIPTTITIKGQATPTLENTDPSIAQHYIGLLSLRAAHSLNGTASSDQNSALFKRALFYIDLKQYEQALIDLNAVLTVTPTDAAAFYWRSRAKFALQDNEGALQDITAAGALAKNEPLYRYQQCAFESEIANNPEARVADCNRTIKLNPRFTSAYNNLANAYNDAGQIGQALATYDALIALDPYYARAFSNRAIVYRNQQNYTLALADADRAIAVEVNNKIGYTVRGNIEIATNNLNAALTDLNYAIALDPDYGPAWSDRGHAHVVLGQTQAAISDLEEAVLLTPNDDNDLYNLGVLNGQLGNSQKAIDWYSAALAINPQRIDARYNRGRRYRDLEMYSQAIADFTELMTLNPGATAVYLDERGLTYEYSGNFAHALADFTDAIRYDPTDDDVYYSRGTLLVLMNQNAAAIDDLEQAVTLNPTFANAFQMLGFAYTREGKLTRAAIIYMEYLRLSSNQPDAQMQSVIDSAF